MLSMILLEIDKSTKLNFLHKHKSYFDTTNIKFGVSNSEYHYATFRGKWYQSLCIEQNIK